MTPTTKAGRALLADPATGGEPGLSWQEGWLQTVLAIEREAAAAERERSVELVRAMTPKKPKGDWHIGYSTAVEDLLAILAEPSE